MGKQVLLIGCAPPLDRDLQSHCGHGLMRVAALPDLRASNLLELLHAADLVLLHADAAPRDLPKICAHLRGQTNRPLLVALRDPTEAEVTQILEAGADDAVDVAISPRELLARIRAHLRRDQEYANGHVRPAVTVGELFLDSARHEVQVRGQPINLTPREFELLEHLARQAGRAVPREELLEEVWGYNTEMTTRTLDVHVGRVRQKIERDPRSPKLIVTVPGVGYKLQAP